MTRVNQNTPANTKPAAQNTRGTNATAGAQNAKTTAAAAGGAKTTAAQPQAKTQTDKAKTGGGQKADLDLKAFQRMDANKDGKLTGSEIRKKQASFDKNGDKVVTQEEFKISKNAQRAEEQLKRADKNKDGTLSGNEVSAKLKGADENGDGILTQGEVRRFQNKGANEVTMDARFKAFDQNGDGVLTGNEAANEKWAKGLDANTDGKITLDEFKEVRAKQRLEAQFKEYDQDGDGFLAGKNIQADVLAAKDSDKDGRLSLDEWLGIKKPEASPEPAPAPETVQVPDPVIEPEVSAPTVDPAPAAPPAATAPSSPGLTPSAPPASTQAPPASSPVQTASPVAAGGAAVTREAVLGQFTSLLGDVSKLDFSESKANRDAAFARIKAQLDAISQAAGKLPKADAGAVETQIAPLRDNLKDMEAAAALLP